MFLLPFLFQSRAPVEPVKLNKEQAGEKNNSSAPLYWFFQYSAWNSSGCWKEALHSVLPYFFVPLFVIIRGRENKDWKKGWRAIGELRDETFRLHLQDQILNTGFIFLTSLR